MQDGRELHQALKARAPAKIDIGPVYTQDPAKRAAYKGESGARAFRPVERELVFDIDLTDYDDVRNSGSGTSMSSKCWILMAIAIKVPCLSSAVWLLALFCITRLLRILCETAFHAVPFGVQHIVSDTSAFQSVCGLWVTHAPVALVLWSHSERHNCHSAANST